MTKKKHVSIRLKLILLLVLVSVSGLFFYGLMAVNIFIKDKKTYIYDTSEVVARTLASQVRSEIFGLKRISNPIENSIDTKKFKFSNLSNQYFLRQQTIEHIFIYLPTTGSSYKEMDHLYLPNRVIKKYAPGGEVIEGLLKQAMEKGFAIQEVNSRKRYFTVVRKGTSPHIKRDYLILSVFASPAMFEAFATPSAYKNYLLSKNKFMSMEPKYKRTSGSEVEIGSVDFFKPIFVSKFPTGVADIENHAKKRMLVSFSKVGVVDLIVASVVERDKAFRVINEIIYKSVFFLSGILSIALLIGVLASHWLSSSLQELRRSVVGLANGESSEVFVSVNSSDEVGLLADEINNLAEKLKKSADKDPS